MSKSIYKYRQSFRRKMSKICGTEFRLKIRVYQTRTDKNYGDKRVS